MDKSKTSPLVSILTSCYNGGKFIEQYKNCLLSQTYRPIECIIINDGSEDDSGPLLNNLSEEANQQGIHTRIIHQQNTGNALAISRAYGISTGEYITCWDIDDIFFPENISILVDTLNSSPDCAAAHANGFHADESNKDVVLSTFSEKNPKYTGQNLFEHLLAGTSWNWPGAYMVKSHVLEGIYGGRKIPIPRLWKNSQNLQLLLPACYVKSVYQSQPVMKYIYYKHSISHITPTYEEELRRINAYEDIRIQLLEIMGLTSEYQSIVLKAFNKIKMQTAYHHNERPDFVRHFNTLKKLRALTTEDFLMKCIICKENKIKQLIYKIIHKIHLSISSKYE